VVDHLSLFIISSPCAGVWRRELGLGFVHSR
jgi:hypothetical protein